MQIKPVFGKAKLNLSQTTNIKPKVWNQGLKKKKKKELNLSNSKHDPR